MGEGCGGAHCAPNGGTNDEGGEMVAVERRAESVLEHRVLVPCDEDGSLPRRVRLRGEDLLHPAPEEPVAQRRVDVAARPRATGLRRAAVIIRAYERKRRQLARRQGVRKRPLVHGSERQVPARAVASDVRVVDDRLVVGGVDGIATGVIRPVAVARHALRVASPLQMGRPDLREDARHAERCGGVAGHPPRPTRGHRDVVRKRGVPDAVVARGEATRCREPIRVGKVAVADYLVVALVLEDDPNHVRVATRRRGAAAGPRRRDGVPKYRARAGADPRQGEP